MPRAPSPRRRAGTLLRFPVGVVLVTWQYFWRTTAVHRTETEGSVEDLPPPLPPELVDECSKVLGDGEGPMFHRRFTVRIEDGVMGPEELMEAVASDLNRAAPTTVAVFHKTVGEAGTARVGDEYRVQMPGPWDGPVRVIEREAGLLRLGTLHGHLEAGQIQFTSRAAGDAVEFETEAWSRAGSRLADVLYSRMRVAKEMQLNMWMHFCLRAAAIAGGHPRGGISIQTRALPATICETTPGR
jgi:hypothetical protein